MTFTRPSASRAKISPRVAALTALATVCIAPTIALAQESCAIQRSNLCDGCTVARRVTVQKDKGCVFRNSIDTQIFGITVTVRPKNGSYGKMNQTMQAYVPRKGFVGSDYVEYVISYELYGKRASTTIQNQITVQEGQPF